MTEKMKKALHDVLNEVLEQFAFMFVDMPEDEDIGEWKGEYYHASITFKGPVQGALTISAPEPLCRELAANILGDDADDIPAESAEDAIKELVNIVCGDLVSRLYGEDDIFDLTVPGLCRIDRGKWLELSADADVVRICIEEQPMLAGLMVAA